MDQYWYSMIFRLFSIDVVMILFWMDGQMFRSYLQQFCASPALQSAAIHQLQTAASAGIEPPKQVCRLFTAGLDLKTWKNIWAQYWPGCVIQSLRRESWGNHSCVHMDHVISRCFWTTAVPDHQPTRVSSTVGSSHKTQFTSLYHVISLVAPTRWSPEPICSNELLILPTALLPTVPNCFFFGGSNSHGLLGFPIPVKPHQSAQLHQSQSHPNLGWVVGAVTSWRKLRSWSSQFFTFNRMEEVGKAIEKQDHTLLNGRGPWPGTNSSAEEPILSGLSGKSLINRLPQKSVALPWTNNSFAQVGDRAKPSVFRCFLLCLIVFLIGDPCNSIELLPFRQPTANLFKQLTNRRCPQAILDAPSFFRRSSSLMNCICFTLARLWKGEWDMGSEVLPTVWTWFDKNYSNMQRLEKKNRKLPNGGSMLPRLWKYNVFVWSSLEHYANLLFV